MDKCIFCGQKNDSDKKLLLSNSCWISKLQIRYINNDDLLDELSVCPLCRPKYTIEELYMIGITRRLERRK